MVANDGLLYNCGVYGNVDTLIVDVGVIEGALMRELTGGLMVDAMSDVMTPLHDGEDGGELLLCFFEVPATCPASTHRCVGLEGVVSVLAWSPIKASITHICSFPACETSAFLHSSSYPYQPVPTVH